MKTKLGDIATQSFSIWAIPNINISSPEEVMGAHDKPLFYYKMYHNWEKPYMDGCIKLGDVEITQQVPVGIDLLALCVEQLEAEKASIVKKYAEDIESINIQLAHVKLLGNDSPDFIPAERPASQFDDDRDMPY